MDAVQRIECRNKAAFDMSFVITTGPESTPSSGNYPVLQSRTIDMSSTKWKEGVTVWAIVSAYWGPTQDASEKFTFAMNGKTAVYEIKGTIFGFSINFIGIEDNPGNRPPGFPLNIPIKQESFVNWAQAINIPVIWTCAPRSAADVAEACNWAAKNGYAVRHRGIIHGWSPLAVTPGLPSYDKILVVDTTVSLNNITFIPASGTNGPAVKAEAGTIMGDLLTFMEVQAGGKGAAPGYSFPHIPAPENLTVGGVVAINAHGTAVSTPPNDAFATTYGSMSNRILSLTAVVTDPNSPTPDTYQLKTFERGDKDTTALMTQLGRSFITDVTFQVIDNYNLRCVSITDIDQSVLFKAPSGTTPPPNSCGDFLNKNGRIEVIWFPFTSFPWLKVWTVEAKKPAASRLVDKPNNYPFSDNLPDAVTAIIDKILTTEPGLTVPFGQMMLDMTIAGLDGKVFGFPLLPQSRDIWGASKNTMFYVKDTTLRVTANGYAVLMNKSYVQQSIADFTGQFEKMLYAYKNLNKFPVNSPLEIRVTGLDSGDGMPSITGGPAGRPVISSLATDAETIKNNWDVAVWFDVLTLPTTKYSLDFYSELEDWFMQHFTAPTAKVIPEWSKGWAYSTSGAWTNTKFMDEVKVGFTNGRAADDNWAWETATLAKYDKFNLFQSQLTQTLFS